MLRRPRVGVEVQLYSFFNLGAIAGGWSTPRPGRFTPVKGPVPICIGGWVGPRADLDRCGKLRPSPGFYPRTVQPVASRYTD